MASSALQQSINLLSPVTCDDDDDDDTGSHRLRSTSSYQFVRSESKQEVGWRDSRVSYNKWSSISALGRDSQQRAITSTGFGRLRKSYATMRKSFRLQLNERQVSSSAVDDSFVSGKNIVGQLGVGAARLLRNIYPRGDNQSDHQLDSTSGSFKVLASNAIYGTTGGSSPSRKSEAELEIEQRLRRSKRRVLPSARYQAPNCQQVCEDLNMDELEAIKRDNLRLTLRAQRQLNQSSSSLVIKKPVVSMASTVCSCTKLYGSNSEMEEASATCCCTYDSAVPSPTSSFVVAGAGAGDGGRRTATPTSADHSKQTKRRAEADLADDDDDDELDNDEQTRLAKSRASGGFVGDKSNSKELGEATIRLTSTGIETESENENENDGNGNGNDNQRDHDHDDRSMGEFSSDDDDDDEQLENLCGGGGSSLAADCECFNSDRESTASFEQSATDWKLQVYDGDASTVATAWTRESSSVVEQQCSVVRVDGDDELRQERQVAAIVQRPPMQTERAARNAGCSNRLGGVTQPQLASRIPAPKQQQQPSAAAGQLLRSKVEVMQSSNERRSRATSYLASKRALGDAIELVEARHEVSAQFTDSRVSGRQRRRQEMVETAERPQPLLQIGGAISDHQEVQTNCRGDIPKVYQDQDRHSKEEEDEEEEEEVYMCDGQVQANSSSSTFERQDNSTKKVMLTEADIWLAEAARRQLASAGLRRDYMIPGGEQAAVDEHLYASISGGSHTSSPEREPMRQVQQQRNREKSLDESYSDYNMDQIQRYQYELQSKHRLFEKQLNNNIYQSYAELNQQAAAQLDQHRVAFDQRLKPPKKSLLSRIKNLIVPASTKSYIKQSELPLGAHLPVDLEQQSGGRGRSRWQKSATLSSRSTQNLLGASMRCLSSSRKSVNLINSSDHQATERRPSLVNGFLTLGRRNTVVANTAEATNKQQQLELEVSALFRDTCPATSGGAVSADRYHFGSVDSLPSADSGLSCSNLQHSSSSDENYSALRANSSNLYSRAPPELQISHHHQFGPPMHQRQVVGRAQALVDCNPCAYDKEALVFKRGDIIEILERDQSGTWIGRCGDQVGHFKFINVTELPNSPLGSEEHEHGEELYDAGSGGSTCCSNGNCTIREAGREGEREQDQQASVANLWSPNQQYLVEQRKVDKTIIGGGGGGTFVTKLEINSTSAGEAAVAQQQRTESRLSNRSTINRRSLSMNTIDNHQSEAAQTQSEVISANDTTAEPVELRSNLTSSNETIMSSLEQLLFAIGLAGEQVTPGESRSSDGENNRELHHHDNHTCEHLESLSEATQCSSAEKQQVEHSSSSSYLEVLSRGGISNLDSFSAIDDLQKLEQMGILDDEHQRRLLMAAKIIRQASQAARLDFIENRQQRQQQRITGASLPTDCQSDRERDACRLNARNEPVYVNLTGPPPTVSSNGAANGGGRSHNQLIAVGGGVQQDGDDGLDPIDYDREKVDQEYTRSIAGTSFNRQRRWPTLSSNSKLPMIRRPERRVNSINQSVVGHYHSRQSPNNTQETAGQDTSSSSLLNANNCVAAAAADRVNANCPGTVSDQLLTGRAANGELTRGYSVRVSSSSRNRRQSIATAAAAAATANAIQSLQQTIDLARCSGRQDRSSGLHCCDTEKPRVSSPPSASTTFKTNYTTTNNNNNQPPRYSPASGESRLRKRCSQPQSRFLNQSIEQVTDAGLNSEQLAMIVDTNSHIQQLQQSKQINHHHHHHHHHQHRLDRTTNVNTTTTAKQHPNLGSQINSKSAYDLRLDLSHYFS